MTVKVIGYEKRGSLRVQRDIYTKSINCLFIQPVSFSMTNGAMYFAEQKDFERYRQAVKQPKKEVS